ncbi:uncharacterized protein LOC124883026 [Girardinichthys multiradiatus]|uniref:uncharacterized protein LOC124883026 n=1 Tax=Girardinichthys multiradiatus TaxID=208333 RepID=UPI001FAC2336|nr:uncharacterized protein LOC124883026 [Girardinichthys multiradiatus]
MKQPQRVIIPFYVFSSRMALAKLLNSHPETPYRHLPPLHVSILKLKERPKVLSWTFTENTAIPASVKENKIAALTDGELVTTVTLFEEFAGKVKEGSSYIIRGHELRGQGPPFYINITSRTQFFRGPALRIEEHLLAKAEALLEPPSPLTPLDASLGTKSLMTVEGEVVEVSAIKKVGSRKEQIPLKTIKLKQDQHIIPLSLWREAATVALAVGDTISLSHVKASKSSYGNQLQTTTFSMIKAKEEVRTSSCIIGVMEGEEGENLLRVLFEDGQTALISQEMWAPFDEPLKLDKIQVNVKLSGNKIVHIRQM